MLTRMRSRKLKLSQTLRSLAIALLVASFPSTLSVRPSLAQSSLDIRGAMSLKIVKGRVSFKIGEVANVGTSELPSGRLEVSVWLSKKPYDETRGLQGIRLAKCTLDGMIGGETVADVSCQAKLRPFSRGKYYIILALSELDTTSSTFMVRDQFTFSKRLKF